MKDVWHNFGFAEPWRMAAAVAVPRLLALWGVDDRAGARLLGIMPSQLQDMRDAGGWVPGLPHETATRMSLLLSIHGYLRVIFTEPARRYHWVNAPNDAFDGQTPLEVMLMGLPALHQVRRHLDVQIDMGAALIGTGTGLPPYVMGLGGP